jgi:hypothetical protein
LTPETEERVRDRMRRLELPEAPDALRARIAEVAATRPPMGIGTEVARSGRLLVPIAAMLLIGGAAILGSGGGPRPPSGRPSDAAPAGPAVATLQVLAANYETPSHPGGLTFRVELQGPGGPWSGQLEYAELGALTSVNPPLPEKLAAGSYLLRTEIRVSGDVIYPGESGPRDYGATATCTSSFVVTPETRVVSMTLGYWADRRCAAGTITAADARTLATFLDMPSYAGACGEDVGGCDYRLTLSGPGGTWGSVYHTVKPPSQLVINPFTDLPLMLSPGTYRLDASLHRMSREPEPGVGHQSEIDVAGTCSVEFTVGPEANSVLASIQFQGETCTAGAETDLVPTAPLPSAVGPIATPTP